MHVPMQGRARYFALTILRRCILLTVISFAASAVLCQSVSLRLKNVTLEKAFREMEKEIEQRFVYTSEMIAVSKRVSLNVSNESLPKVLELIFANQPLEYELDEHFIKVRFKPMPVNVQQKRVNVAGRITDESGKGLEGITISTKQSGRTTASENDGNFLLQDVEPNDVLIISGIGYAEKQIPLNGRTDISVALPRTYTGLDETIVMAYGTTTKRLATGNITKISAEEITRQPVSNPLAALQGRVPGLTVTQTTGYAGGAIDVLLRGQNSLV